MKKETRRDDAFDYPELDKMSPEEFYDTYRDFMTDIAKRERLDHYQTDVAIDDVLVTVFVEKRCHFDPQIGRFSNYLTSMVRNACRSLKRREYRYDYYEEDDLVRLREEHGAVTKLNANMMAELAEIRGIVEECIESLKKTVHSKLMVDAFAMMLLEDKGPMEIAKLLNVTPNKVSMAMNRYKPRLKAMLKKIME